MKRVQFSFDLPADLIAKTPAPKREYSRLMLVERSSGHISHHRFDDFPALISTEDYLVINTTRVNPAKLFGRVGEKTVEMLVVKTHTKRDVDVLAQPARHLRPGVRIDFGEGMGAEVTGMGDRGRRHLRLNEDIETIYRLGYAPLPPYIKRKTDDALRLRQFDLERYQTVYASRPGAVAAPTAGLHFTPEILEKIGRNHEIVPLNLTVGEATFQKIEAERLEDHRMGREEIEIPLDSARLISQLRQQNKRLLAVGTTSVRSLETWATLNCDPLNFVSDIFIYPGFQFKLVDRLLTNFHLPESSLFILVCAFAGLDLMKKAYEEAIANRYRFFSYGDAMLII